MAKTLPQVADSTALAAPGPLRDSFLEHLAAANKSPSTRESRFPPGSAYRGNPSVITLGAMGPLRALSQVWTSAEASPPHAWRARDGFV